MLGLKNPRVREHRRTTRPQANVLVGGALVVVFFTALAIAGCSGGGGDQPTTVDSSARATAATEATNQPTEQVPDTVGLVPTGDPIRLNDRGPRVERLQTALANLGFSPGPIDGIFGPKTLRAVRAFQRSVDLEPTGIVNNRIANALNNALTDLEG